MTTIPKPPADMYESAFNTMSEELHTSARKLQDALEEVKGALEQAGKAIAPQSRSGPAP